VAQITFTLDAKLENDFRKKAGVIYGARKDSIGIALRDAIREFLVTSDVTSDNSKPEVQA
jgi:hypothetical protein